MQNYSYKDIVLRNIKKRNIFLFAYTLFSIQQDQKFIRILITTEKLVLKY